MSDVKPVAWIADLHDPFIQEGPQRSRQIYQSLDDAESDCVEWDGRIIDHLYSQETVIALQAEIVALRKDAERWRAIDKFAMSNESAGCDLLQFARSMAIAADIDLLSVEYDGEDVLIDAVIAKERS